MKKIILAMFALLASASSLPAFAAVTISDDEAKALAFETTVDAIEEGKEFKKAMVGATAKAQAETMAEFGLI